MSTGEWDSLGPFTDREVIHGIVNGSLSPMNVCKSIHDENALRIKDAINFSNNPMPERIEITNQDLMLIPKFFLDKEDPELAMKMERTLASAEDYGS